MCRDVKAGVDGTEQIKNIVAGALLSPRNFGQKQFQVGESSKLKSKGNFITVGGGLAEHPHSCSVTEEAHENYGVSMILLFGQRRERLLAMA